MLFLQCPEHGVNRLSDRLLLFRHDYTSPNVLQLINSASEILDETVVEIILTGNWSFVKSCLLLAVIGDLLKMNEIK